MAVVWTPTYYSWAAMVARCNNPARNNYHNYGGRGIGVCEKWRRFQGFLEDMGERPEGTSIDRINVDGDYCRENCRWATKAAQNQNRRNNKLTPEDAEAIRSSSLSRRVLAAQYGVSKTMVYHIKRGAQWKV